MSPPLDIRDAIVAALEAASLPETIVVDKRYSPQDDTLPFAWTVSVWLSGVLDTERASRAADAVTQYAYSIAIRKAITKTDAAQCDAAIDLLEAIKDTLRATPRMARGRWLSTTQEPVYDADFLRDSDGWATELIATYEQGNTDG